MKKMISLTLCLVLVLSFTISASAIGSLEIQEEVYDIRKIPEKSFQPTQLNTGFSTQSSSGPYWTAKVELKGSGVFIGFPYAVATSVSYTDSKKEKRETIDLIYAKARIYINGTLSGSKEDSTKNASYASARADNSHSGLITSEEAYGNHKFEESGYQSWYPETYDN